MNRNTSKLIALILGTVLLLGMLASCGGGTTDSESTNSPDQSVSETQSSSVESSDTEANTSTETEPNVSSETETTKETSTEKESDTTVETVAPSIDNIEHGVLIENAYSLINGVNAYFTDGKRTDFVLENLNMSLGYALAAYNDQQISYLNNNEGKPYLTDTADVFVKLKNGNVFYASNSTIPATANLYRLGYYMYEARFEEQNFLGRPIEDGAIELSISGGGRNQVKLSANDDGSTHVVLTNSDDPFVTLSGVNCSADEYPYLQITLKADIDRMYGLTVYLAAGSQSTLGKQTKTVIISPSEEYQTYLFPLYQVNDYTGSLKQLRLDFAGQKMDSYDIKEIKLLKGNVAGTPDALGLNRSFFVYSDKLHHVLQVATKDVPTSDIAEIGMETRIAADTVAKLIVKDKNGTHTSLDEVDWESAEYVGFDIKDAGIFGYILPADGTSGRLTVSHANGYYTILQSRVPENNTVLPSGKKNDSTGKIDPLVPLNGNDFFMGQRLYTDESHDFNAFLIEAEQERHPLSASNFVIEDAASNKAEFVGYNALRGIYEITLDGEGFNAPFFMYPNKYPGVRFTIKGDDTDRRLYLMTAPTTGNLECAVLLDENNMLLPIPIEVGKNFSEANGERNLWNIEDAIYSEAIIPMTVKAGESETYNFLNLYQNWGKYPLKQISWIQFYAPYYHLSTGVTESNCIVPYYSCKNARGLGTLPDHRAASAPFWAGQPQHNSGGSHIWLVYTDADGIYSASENTRNTIDSYGPTYADLTMEYLSDDGNIKVTYTHTEFPQTDENRAYYEMKYEVLGDVSFADFSRDFHFYKVTDNDGKGSYINVGYLDKNNKCVTVDAAKGDESNKYVLGDECPYFSFFNMPDWDRDSTSAEGYTNLSFLIYNSEFTIGGKKTEPNFAIVNENNFVRLSLDLEEVTLKAGDSFTINCIVMPWGSQESVYNSDAFAGDQNVRDVRENTLLNPLTPQAIADCEVIESVFVPKLRTTNGRSAEFTLTGGENNVAVRVYGFKKLTVPVIEELVDGKWIPYRISSAYAPDYQGNAHYFDGYSVHYDQNGTFSYSFVVEMDHTDKDGRTFRIKADADFTKWPEDLPEIERDEADLPINVYVSAEDIATAANMSGMFGGVEYNRAENYVRVASKPSALESYFTPFPGGTQATGQYFVIKYRIPKENPNNIESFEVFTSTVDSSASYSGCYNIGSQIKKDGEWHLMVIDLASFAKESFAPAADGTYKANFVRLDPFNDSIPEGNKLDLAFIGFSDNPEDVYKLGLDLEKVELLSHKDGKTQLTPIDPLTGEALEVTGDDKEEETQPTPPPSTGDATSSKSGFNVYLNATALIKASQAPGTGHLGDEELLENGSVARIHYCSDQSKSEAVRKESYFYLYKASDGLATGQYLVLKYRAPEQIGSIQIYAGTASTSAGQGGNMYLYGAAGKDNLLFIGDNEWHVVVVDLSKAMSKYTADANGKFAAQHVRLDLFNLDTPLTDGRTTYVDLAYAGLCDDYTEILGADTDVTEILFFDGTETVKIPTVQ